VWIETFQAEVEGRADVAEEGHTFLGFSVV